MTLLIKDDTPLLMRCIVGLLKEASHYKQPNENGCILLEEKNDGANPNTLQHVIISGLSPVSVVFSADKLSYGIIETKTRSNVWENVKDYRKVTDYILLTKIKNVYYFVYIELKTGYKTKEYIQQLRCARGQMEHLLYLIRYFNAEVLKDIKLYHRFIKFSKKPVPKGVTQGDDGFLLPSAPLCNDEPTQAYQCLIEEGETVNIQDLILPAP